MIHLPMFDQFVLITLHVLVLYSLAHLKLHSHLQPLKLYLRLWIHLHVNPSVFVSPQNYQILLILVIHCLFEPSSYKETILDPLWQQAMDEELSALYKTNTWDLVPLSSGKSVVGCR